MAATTPLSSMPFVHESPRTPTDPIPQSNNNSSPQMPFVPVKKLPVKSLRLTPPTLNTRIITVSFFKDRERISLSINLIMLLTTLYILYKKVDELTVFVKNKFGVRIPYLETWLYGLIGLALVNILLTLSSSSIRFIRKSFGLVDGFSIKKKPLQIQKSLLKDTAETSKHSPLRSVVSGVVEQPQTPLRSPFAKQSPFSSSSAAILSEHSGANFSSSQAASTPKVLFTPSAKSINLRTPSALLTSPNSPFSVKTPSESRTSVGSQIASGQASPVVEKPSSIKDSSPPATPSSKSPKKEVVRRVFKGDECLSQLSLQRDFENRIESFRSWLWSVVIKPLVEDIDRVEAAFQANGMSHLGPLCPASMTLLTSSVDLRSSFFVSPGTVGATSRPQTLMDLAQQSRHDPMVQARLRIEKYLDVAAGAGQVAAGPRIALVRRLRAIASSPFVPPDTSADDALLFMHLFCTFLDERLPTSDLYALQPFSSRYFIPLVSGQDPAKHDLRGLPIAIAQSSTSPPTFIIITNDECFIPVASNPLYSTLHALVIFIAYVEKRLAGHLGIANLASKSINLFKHTF